MHAIVAAGPTNGQKEERGVHKENAKEDKVPEADVRKEKAAVASVEPVNGGGRCRTVCCLLLVFLMLAAAGWSIACY